jgi:hypothetical protein
MVKSSLNISLKDLENLNLPDENDETPFDLYDKVKFERLNPESKEIMVREAVRNAIRKYGEDGLTLDEIIGVTSHSRKAIQKHLNSLISLREVYSQKRNKRLTLYFPNGKPLHSVNKKRLEWEGGNNIFELSLALGPRDKLFFHILEKRFSIIEGEVAEGGILIPLDYLDTFIKGLQELKEEVGGIHYE